MRDDPQEVLRSLRDRLQRYPLARYPVQHATAQFHLGVTLTNLGSLEDAQQALQKAAEIFSGRLPEEHAKSLLALGAALRAAGDIEAARDAFVTAGEQFADIGLELEQGAALYNLALVEADAERPNACIEALGEARRLLDPERVPMQAASAALEMGRALLASGDTGAAVDAFRQSASLAGRIGNHATIGAAHNGLGLAHLSEGRTSEAVRAFKSAAGAHPRTIRPEGYAMAKANLALAHEAAGDAPRARLAAAQALTVPDPPAAVQRQASATLERLGRRYGDLISVIEEEPPEVRPALMREELWRWIAVDEPGRRRECQAWIEGQLARPDGTELAELWLGALLEQPPDEMRLLVTSLQHALRERDATDIERFRAEMSRAMIRFEVPQWMRLKDTFNKIAADLGDEPAWD